MELHPIAAREANQARSGASQINPAAGFSAADMLAAAKVCHGQMIDYRMVRHRSTKD